MYYVNFAHQLWFWAKYVGMYTTVSPNGTCMSKKLWLKNKKSKINITAEMLCFPLKPRGIRIRIVLDRKKVRPFVTYPMITNIRYLSDDYKH
jgi:hypothetical protein